MEQESIVGVKNMKKQFTARYSVTIGDINYGGHLGNERALVIFQDARIRFFGSLGLSEGDIGDETGIIMVESGVRYRREIFLHDELVVTVGVSEVKTKKFVLEYDVTRESDAQQVLSGFTIFLAFDYTSRKVTKIPSQFIKKTIPFSPE
jgi:acyl-CoA thioester hydrolase